MILSELATLVSAQHGVFYSMTNPTDGSEPVLELQAGYGFEERRQLWPPRSAWARASSGQCGKEKKRILLTEVPGDYVRISSGLGASPPLNIIAMPGPVRGVVCRAVIELASFSAFSVTHQTFLDSITESIGIVLSTIQASALTETLLQQAQSLAEELRSQQGELRESNEGLERQASLLAERNREASNRNQEIEQSKHLLEEKAAQLAISSKYKSEFIANMSHELRTPLNSLLILAEQLEDNPDNNMTDTQVQYASVISTSGKELMGLLNSILDLAKVESGTMAAELSQLSVGELRSALLREFEPVAKGKGLGYSIDLAPGCPESIVTDSTAPAPDPEEPARQRLQVHRARQRPHPGPCQADGLDDETGSLADASGGRGLRGQRHRHRDRRRAAATHLRGVRPGRRHDGPALRGHRAGPLDQSGAGGTARRGDHRDQHARAGQHVHRLSSRQRSRRRRPGVR